MTKLNCKVGDLAITVNTELWMNQGFIVRVIEWIGMMEWSNFGLIPVWRVEPVNEFQFLYYKSGDWTEALEVGPVPDRCLRPITPPKGELEILEEDLELVD